MLMFIITKSYCHHFIYFSPSGIIFSKAPWATPVTECLQIAMERRANAPTAAGVTKTQNPAARWWTAQMTPTSSIPMDPSPRYHQQFKLNYNLIDL